MEWADFLSFKKMITPLVIQIIFWIGAGVTVLFGLGYIVMGLTTRLGGGAVIVGLLELILGPLVVRIYCELLILFFEIHKELVQIRMAVTGNAAPGQGFPVTPLVTPPPSH